MKPVDSQYDKSRSREVGTSPRYPLLCWNVYTAIDYTPKGGRLRGRGGGGVSAEWVGEGGKEGVTSWSGDAYAHC